MPSSISSSNRRLPSARWGRVLGGAILAWALFLGLMELELAHRGVQPTLADSERLWIRHRAEASRLGERALVLIGASRIQLAADLDTLKARSGLQPVQLALDGASFIPILEGLAADPSFRGSVIVDFDDRVIATSSARQRSERYQKAYEEARNTYLPAFPTAEGWLTDQWRQRLRSYADSARPITALERRILSRQAPQYLVTLPDRSRLADYSRIDESHAMVNILRRHGLPLPPGADLERDGASIRAAVRAVTPNLTSLGSFERETRKLAGEVSALHARGAKVYFLVLPKSGLVKAMEERQFPRRQFWNRFVADIGAPAVHFEDVPSMRGLICPDGSHLDYRERAQFTAALVAAFGLDQR